MNEQSASHGFESRSVVHGNWAIARSRPVNTINSNTLRYGAIFLAFAACLFLETYGLLNITDYWASLAAVEDRASRPYQLAGFALFVSVAIGLNYHTFTSRRVVLTYVSIFFGIFSFYCLISAVWSLAPLTSALYAVANFLLFIAVKAAFQWDKSGRMPWGGALAILLFFVLAIAKFGIEGRQIGGNQPNIMGALAFAGVVLIQFSQRRVLSLVVTILLISLTAAISSRTFLLCSVCFLAISYCLRLLSTRQAPRNAFLAFAVIGLLTTLMASYSVVERDTVVSETLDAIFVPDDATRGLDSGLTGRTVLWHEGMARFKEAPLLGYGFRTRLSIAPTDGIRQSAHSGYINLLIDVGLLGLLLFLVMVVLSLNQRIRDFLTERKKFNVRHDTIIYLAYFPEMVVILMTEPTHLYIGLPHQILNFMCLFVFRPKMRSTVGAGAMRVAQRPGNQALHAVPAGLRKSRG